MAENDWGSAKIDFKQPRPLNTKDVFILARILKRCAKQFISLVDKWERGEDV